MLDTDSRSSVSSMGDSAENSDYMLSDGDSDGDIDWEPPLPPEDNEPPPPPPDDDDDPLTPPPSPPMKGMTIDWGKMEESDDDEQSAQSQKSDVEESETLTDGTAEDSEESDDESGDDSDTDPDIRMKVTPEGVTPVVVPASVFRRRRNIAMEIVETETTYVKQLSTVVQRFVVPFQKKEFDLTQSDIMTLFSNIEALRNLHNSMLEQLKPRVQDWQDSSCIGDIFFENSKWIKLYKHYVNNYDTAMDFLATLRKKNAKVRKYLKELEYTPAMANLNLEAYLVVPVQRIPRYVLLLRDLSRNTPETHEDYVPIEGALNLIEEVATYINVHKAKSDAMRTLADCKARIANLPFDIVTPDRELLREAIFVVNKERRKLFVFNDLLIIASSETRLGKHKYRAHITLTTAAVQREDNHVISVVSPEGMNKIQLSNPNEFEDWSRFMEQTVDDARASLLRSAFADSTDSSEGSLKFIEQQQQRYAEARHSVMERLARSERDYVDSLQNIIDLFIQPLHQHLEDENPTMVSPAAEKSMCSNIVQLFDMHSCIRQDFDERLKNWNDKSGVTDLFKDRLASDFGDSFRLYIDYVTHYATQVQTLDYNLGNNPAFAKWFYNSTHIGDFANLKIWFEFPLRRISEYYLLLQEMENNTPKKDLEYSPLHQTVVNIGILKEKMLKKTSEHKQEALTGSKHAAGGPQHVPKWMK